MIKIGNICLEKFSNRPEFSVWFRWKNTCLVFGYMNYIERSKLQGTHKYNKKGWYYSLNKKYFAIPLNDPRTNKAGWRSDYQLMQLILLGKFQIRII